MPVIHPYANSASGVGHGHDYLINDYDRAVVAPAKVMTASILELLGDGGRAAREILSKHTAAMSADQYVALQRERFSIESYDPS
jgi:hypothetical protein